MVGRQAGVHQVRAHDRIAMGKQRREDAAREDEREERSANP
jgi:hypothetical protein